MSNLTSRSRAGRKPIYHFNEAIAWRIFGLIVEGRSISQVCREPGIPSRWVLDKWRYTYDDFNKLVEDAIDMRGDYYRDALLHPLLSSLGSKFKLGIWQPRGPKFGSLFWLSKYRSQRNFGKKRLHYGYVINTGIHLIQM